MVRKASITLVLMAFSLLSFLFFQIIKPPPTGITVDADRPTGSHVKPVWTRMNVWDLGMAPGEPPAPFIREVILMTATGGRESSEMYKQGSGEDHNFTKLDIALNKVLSAGLRPTIVLGNTPEALSDAPGYQGAFNANVGAPTDYELYRGYMQSLFEHLVEKYGVELVRAWDFRLMTEPDNADWWAAGRLEYQKLYDYTVAAAHSVAPGVVIDPGNLMTPLGDGCWTEELVQWFTSEPNPLLPPSVSRTARRLGISCYAEGQMGMDPRELGRIVDELRKKMAGMDDVMITVDEGMILFDEEGKRLWLGDGTELGAAWNAAIFKVCMDHDIERYVQWGFQTDGVRSPSYNVITMYERMLGAEILETGMRGGAAPAGSYIDALATLNEDGVLRILVFHYWPDRRIRFSEKVKIKIRGLPAGSYTLEHWRVDQDHSNFFTTWLQDSENIPRIDIGSGSGSRFDLAATNVLSREGWELWVSRRERYLAMDDLERLEPAQEIEMDGEYVISFLLPSNSISLLEIRRI